MKLTMTENKVYIWIFYIFIMLSIFKELIVFSKLIQVITVARYTILILLFFISTKKTLFNKSINIASCKLLIGFLLLQVIVITFSIYSYNYNKLITTSLSTILFIVVFFLGFEINSSSDKEKIINAILTISMVSIYIAIAYSIINGQYLIYTISGRTRFNFGFINVNRLGSLLYIAINYSIALLINGSKRKKIYTMNLVSMIVVLVLTGSRTPILLIIVQLILYIFYSNKYFRKINIYYLLVGLSFVLINTILSTNNLIHSSKLHYLDKLLSYRLTNWKNILMHMNKNELMFGVKNIDTYVKVMSGIPSGQLDLRIDNYQISYLYNYGAIGLSFFFIYFGYFYNIIRKRTDNINLPFLYSLFLSAVIYSFFEGWFISINNITSIMFFILLGYIVKLDKSINSYK